MGLSERKVKQKIGLDPRNLTWSDDKARFSYKHMKALGWEDNMGLGNGLDGNPNHIAVARKLDNGGIGVGRAKKEGDELGGQAGAGLNDVLKRLAASASASPALSPSPAPEAPAEDGDVQKRVRNKMASRQRHLQSKRLASQSAAAMAEILGIPVSHVPTPAVSGTATPSPAPEPSTSESGEVKRETTDIVSTSTMSVSDYFRQKLREKALARQAASGGATPLPDLPPALDFKPSSEWEGSKVKFEEADVKLETLGGYELTAPDEQQSAPLQDLSPAEDENAAKKARKAEKAAKKAAKEAKKLVKTEPVDAPPASEPSKEEVKAAKRAAKEERRKEKADKKRKRED